MVRSLTLSHHFAAIRNGWRGYSTNVEELVSFYTPRQIGRECSVLRTTGQAPVLGNAEYTAVLS